MALLLDYQPIAGKTMDILTPHDDIPKGSASHTSKLQSVKTRGQGAQVNWLFYGQPYDYPLPEQQLYKAMLQDALNSLDSLVKNRNRNTYLAQDVYNWIREQNDDSPHSFVFTCAVLSIDSDWLRRRLCRKYEDLFTWLASLPPVVKTKPRDERMNGYQSKSKTGLNIRRDYATRLLMENKLTDKEIIRLTCLAEKTVKRLRVALEGQGLI